MGPPCFFFSCFSCNVLPGPGMEGGGGGTDGHGRQGRERVGRGRGGASSDGRTAAQTEGRHTMSSTTDGQRRHTAHSWTVRYRHGGEHVTICRICGAIKGRTPPEVTDHTTEEDTGSAHSQPLTSQPLTRSGPEDREDDGN